MASFQAVVLILGIFLFGLLYSAFYDPINLFRLEMMGLFYDAAFDTADTIIWSYWVYLPVAAFVIFLIYGISVTQKG
jgi:hypothetical protein